MSTTDPGYERGYRVACRVRDSLFAIVLLPVVITLGGPVFYALGL